MEDTVACPCGGNYEWIEALNALVCNKCGRHSPYQPKPSYDYLLERVDDLELFLTDFIAKQGLQDTGFVRRAKRLMRLKQ